jgi:ubiquinone/menaquinone biosynthesis C-methylase UbiE
MATEYDAFADIYDLEYGTTTVDLDFYLEHAQAAQSPVLELACGTGRLALRVAEAGIPIVGIDSSEQMLAVAREKAARLEASGAAPIQPLPVEWVQADMRDFDLGRGFGLAMIPARSFLHLLDPPDQVQTLNRVYRHLLPEGKLVLNLFVPNLRIIAEHSASTGQMLRYRRAYTDPASGRRVSVWESRRYDVHRQRIHQKFRYEELDKDGEVLSTRYRGYTLCYIWPREMEHLLVRCGFEELELYGGFERQPFDERSSEQIWVARRP